MASNSISAIKLPPPRYKGEVSVEDAIKKRRSCRSYLPNSLPRVYLSQILWAAQGITDDKGFHRSVPSAGACFPLEVMVIIGEGGVEGIPAGIYHYRPSQNDLELVLSGDFRSALARVAWEQSFIEETPVSLAVVADYRRTTRRYGERGIRYVHIDVGHVGENVHLQAEALGLGTVMVGAFDDQGVARVLNLSAEYSPLYIIPVGFGRKS